MTKVPSGIRTTKSKSELSNERVKKYREKKRLEQQSDRPTPAKSLSKSSKNTSPQPKEEPLARFVGLDGEGRNYPLRNTTYKDVHNKEQTSEYQAYELLRSSSNKMPPLYKEGGLSTVECFSYLCNLSLQEYGGTFVIFGGGYDITMWMRDIPYKDQQYLRTYMQSGDAQKYEYEDDLDDKGKKKKKRKLFPPVYFAEVDDVPNTKYVGFEYEHMPRKWFKVTRYEMYVRPDGTWAYSKDSRGKRIKHGSITIYDVWGFFQGTFVNALGEYGLLGDEDDYQFLSSMKSKRDQFEYMTIDTIDVYCKKECEYLVNLMEKLQGYFRHEAIDIQLTRWDGAGAAASVLLKKMNIKQAIGKPLEPDVLESCLHAYSGGRIELVQYGHTESQKEYTEKQARAYCKKHILDFEKTFISCTFLLRTNKQEEVIKSKAVEKMERYLAMKGVMKPYNKIALKEYNQKIDILLDHYFTVDRVGYFLPCVYDYDINSAYPTTIAELPTLTDGEWLREKEIKTSFCMVRVKWDLSGQRFYPFFYRTNKHLICYPQKGENWIWLPGMRRTSNIKTCSRER